MSELSNQAKEFIKTHAKDHTGLGGLRAFFVESLNSYINLSNFQPEERPKILSAIQKAYYINHILVWKIIALKEERKWAQMEFKAACDEWELIERVIDTYNKRVETRNADTSTEIELIKQVAKDFAPLTIFKGGKVQLQNKHIQRQFEKLRNRHTERLNFHFIVADELSTYIDENELNEFIDDDVKNYIKILLSDLAHAEKYSYTEWAKNNLLFPNDKGIKEAKKFAIYPPVLGVITANNRDREIAKRFLFDDLNAAAEWIL